MANPEILRGTHDVCVCVDFMRMATRRLNVSLDEHRAAKLGRLAARAHVPDGTLARSLLSAAIDDADPDPDHVTDILEGVAGLPERIRVAEAQVEGGDVVDLSDL